MSGLSAAAEIDRLTMLEAEVSRMRTEAQFRAGLLLMPARHERMAKMIDFASLLFKVSSAIIVGPLRTGDACRARFAVMWAAPLTFHMSTTVIGRELGRRDHSTVINGMRRAEKWRTEDPEYRRLTDALLHNFTPKSVQEEAENAPTSH